jgi:hypothetical protein
MILFIVKPTKRWHIAVVALLLIGWSGENLVGIVISNLFNACYNGVSWGSFEGWLDFARDGYDCSYLYRSNIDALCQVYNQVIVPWLAVTILLTNPKVCTFAFLGLCLLPYGPIPFIGFLPFFVILAVKELLPLLKTKKWKSILCRIFSIPNLAASITVFPVMWFYFKSNVAFSTGSSGTAETGAHYISLFVPWEAYDHARILTLILFWFLEFGIYCIPICGKFKKNCVFWGLIATLIVIPVFQIGSGRDFCMNASLPALFVLMIYVDQYIIEEYQATMKFKKACLYVGLLIAILVSFSTIVCDCMSKYLSMKAMQVFPYVADDVGTLADKDNPNFLVDTPENVFFFQYLAR